MAEFPLQGSLFPEVRMPVVERKVPKKPKSQEAGQPRKTTAKVDVEVLRKLKMVSTYRGIDLFDLMDEILREAVDREYDNMIREEAR